MKLQYNKHTGQYFLTIPKKLVEAMNWEKGMEIKIRFNEKGNLVLDASCFVPPHQTTASTAS